MSSETTMARFLFSIFLIFVVIRISQVFSEPVYHPRATSMVDSAIRLRVVGPMDNFLRKLRLFKNMPLHPNHSTIAFMTLMICGDVELNPGPQPAAKHIFPCGYCASHVSYTGEGGIQCEHCSIWFHPGCVSVSDSKYKKLGSSSQTWDCYRCNSHNCGSFTYNMYNVSVSNSFSVLSSTSEDCDFSFNRSTVSESSPRMPHKQSTPNAYPPMRADTDHSTHAPHTPTPNLNNEPTSKQTFSRNQNNLRIVVGNVNSIRYRKAELEAFTDFVKPDIIIFTETKIDKYIFNSEFLPANYECKGSARKDRTADGGGVLIATREGLDPVDISIENNSTESSWVKINVKGEAPIIIGSFYRRDTESSVDQIEDLDEVLKNLSDTTQQNTTLYLGGDFNLPGIDWDSLTTKPNCRHKNICDKLLEISGEHNLHQVQKEATRLDANLDLLFTNKPDLIKETSVIPGTSDHSFVVIDTFHKLDIPKKPRRKIHQWSKADWDGLRRKATEFKQQFLENSPDLDIDKQYKLVTDFVTAVINDTKLVPCKWSSSRRNTPWFTTSLRRMTRKKQRLYNKAKKSHSPRCWDHFKSFRNTCTTAMRKARENYINNIIAEGLKNNDCRPFWRYTKSQRQENCSVASLKDKGQLHSNSLDKAEILNNQFTSVFTSDASDPNANTVLEGPSIPTIPDIIFDETGIAKLLKNIDPKKAHGPDVLPCRLLKELADELAPVFCYIFQYSYDSGTLPSVWNTANVSPIYKKGPVYDAANYRPVSLTCVPCKLMEHVLCSCMRAHFDRFGVLTPLNHGFRSKHSCETQLLLTIHDFITNLTGAKSQIDVAVLDFSKAFDKVPHARLMSKLRLMGIHGKTAEWIRQFLADRTQKVVVDGQCSSSARVLSGVPQGTVLGPLLFLCFINDIVTVVDPHTQIRLFADDCLLYRKISTIQDQIQLQIDLSSLSNWSHSWGMHFNPSKCNILSITNFKDPLIKFYELEGRILDHVEAAKYLGILIENTLTFTGHIKDIVNKANRKLGFLKRNLRNTPLEVRKMAYISLVRSSLEYGSTIWDPYTQSQKNDIEKIQNKAIRWIFDKSPRERVSITGLRNQIGLETLQKRRLNSRLCLFYKMVSGEVVVTVADVGLEASDARMRGNNHPHKFRHKKKNDICTVTRTIPAWNKLNPEVFSADSLDSFKSRLGALCP